MPIAMSSSRVSSRLSASRAEHGLEHAQAEALAGHRGRGEQIDGRLLERGQPPEDDLLDALGHAEGVDVAAAQRRRGRAAADAPQHLFDEERVAPGG